MKKYILQKLAKDRIEELIKRPAIDFKSTFKIVEKILEDVKNQGDKAVKKYTKEFDNIEEDNLPVTDKEISEAEKKIPSAIKKAFESAAKNIEKFHTSQSLNRKIIETSPGVKCFRETRPIEKVGLYIPGGTAPLPSTVLMLALPAKIVGCKKVILCTPPGKNKKVPDIILFAAKIAGVKEIYKIGGAQAIGAMGYGTETVPKVNKIFGPGNQYVTAAKMLLSIDPDGAAMDMPAGPSEVLVIADENSRADFVAADLLSQAEHGVDSQVVLVCNNEVKTDEILAETEKQLASLPRKEIAKSALNNSYAIVIKNISEAIKFSNNYAPEHLILNIKYPDQYLSKILNAGSVFIGPYSCESAGDYASGTNHTLPTYGYAKSYSGVSLESFQKKITFQEINSNGIKNLGPIVEKMAETEVMQAHKNAMTLRIKSLK